jgi:hypothetical protein
MIASSSADFSATSEAAPFFGVFETQNGLLRQSPALRTAARSYVAESFLQIVSVRSEVEIGDTGRPGATRPGVGLP